MDVKSIINLKEYRYEQLDDEYYIRRGDDLWYLLNESGSITFAPDDSISKLNELARVSEKLKYVTSPSMKDAIIELRWRSTPKSSIERAFKFDYEGYQIQ